MMNKHKTRESGFSLIEILIILVAVGIMVAFVVSIYSGVQAHSRNTTRTDAVRTLQEHIESFYSQNMYYPSLKDMNNPDWLKANLKGVSTAMYQDPSWNSKNTKCTSNGHPVLIEDAQPGCFGYHPTNSGQSCEAKDSDCNQYSLTAYLEQGGGIYTLKQLD